MVCPLLFTKLPLVILYLLVLRADLVGLGGQSGRQQWVGMAVVQKELERWESQMMRSKLCQGQDK